MKLGTSLIYFTRRKLRRIFHVILGLRHFEKCLLLVFTAHVIGISYVIVLMLHVVEKSRYHGDSGPQMSSSKKEPDLVYISDLGRPQLNISNAPWFSVETMPRALSQYEHAQYIRLLSTIADLFASVNITFIMCDGTLLGSYISHDVIPWDDDIDLMVHYDDLPRVKKLFRDRSLWERFELHGYHDYGNEYDLNVLLSLPDDADDVAYYHYSILETDTKLPEVAPEKDEHFQVDTNTKSLNFSTKSRGNQTTMPRFHKFKFYHKHSPPAGKQSWRWPYIDIKYFKDNATHVWNLDTPKRTTYISRSDFYPLHFRPLSSLWLPAPRDTRAFLLSKYFRFRCRRSSWSHRQELRQPSRKVRCWRLSRYYPFVWREKLADGVLEILKINEQIIQYVGIPEPVTDFMKPFSL